MASSALISAAPAFLVMYFTLVDHVWASSNAAAEVVESFALKRSRPPKDMQWPWCFLFTPFLL